MVDCRGRLFTIGTVAGRATGQDQRPVPPVHRVPVQLTARALLTYPLLRPTVSGTPAPVGQLAAVEARPQAQSPVSTQTNILLGMGTSAAA